MSDKNPEDDYFARLDREKMARLRQQLEAESGEAAAAKLKELHWHCCGKCGHAMDTHTFRGVEIEICGHCGATLLDRGELEKPAGSDNTGLFRSMLSAFGGDR